MQMIIFGYAATFEVYHVSTAVLDLDHSQESRELISRFPYSGRFRSSKIAKTPADIRAAIDRSDAVGRDRHPGRASPRSCARAHSAPAQIIVDGTNSNTALIALGYVKRDRRGLCAGRWRRTSRGGCTPGSRRRRRSRSNRGPGTIADYNSRWFFVPGVIATLTLVMVVNLTSFAVVREREVGTLEQIMVTPIRPLEFILGKTIPFFCVGLALTALIAGVGTLWFQIPFVGNPFVLLLGTSLYLFSVLGIGLLISTVCLTQQQAFATNFFVDQPGLHALRLQLSDRQHARVHAMALDHQPDDLLSHRHSRDVPQGRGPERALAADAGARGARLRAPGDERAQVPQVAGLTRTAVARLARASRRDRH